MATLRALVCMLAVAAGVPVVEASGLQFEQTAEVQGHNIQSVIKVQGDAFRIDMLAEGMRASMIRNQEGLFNVLHDQGMAMKLPESQAGDDFALIRHVQDFDAYLGAEAAEKIGEETLDGRDCDVYQITSNGSKVWVSRELRFPLRVEVDGQVVVFSNIRRDVSFSDAEFGLPEGVQVMDLDGIDLSQVFGE